MIVTSSLLILDDSSGEDPIFKLHTSLPLSSMFKADSLPSRVLTSIINLQKNVLLRLAIIFGANYY